MKINALSTGLGAALLGACLGLCHGSAWAWLPAQLCLLLILALLQHGQARTRRVALQTWLFSTAYGLASMGYVPLSMPDWRGVPLLLPLTLTLAAEACLPALAAALIHRASRPGSWLWATAWPACWTLFEWLQSQGDYATSWVTLGQMQGDAGPFAGLLPLGGVLLASLAMWAWAALCVEVLRRVLKAQWPGRRLALIALGAPLAGLLLGQLSWTDERDAVSAVLVQAGPANAEHTGLAAADRQWRQQLLTLPQRFPGALILTHQASTQLDPDEESARFVAALEEQLQRQDSDLVLGSYVRAPSGRISNAALSLGVSGRQRYDKAQLLPFGEFLPDWLHGRLPQSWPVPDLDLQRGSPSAEALMLGGHRIALSICVELAFPELWRESAAASDLLVNISSDASHPSMRTVAQALQLAKARALEFGKPLLRTSDWAGSFLVDGRGRLVAQLAPGLPSELRLSVPARSGLTPYARFGQATVLCLCGLILLLAMLRRTQGANARAEQAPAVWRLRRQAGQVLMAALGLLLITAGMMYLMVNTGQMVTEKMRVTNAADAAAYSAGVVEARALNYDAYLNRAMVANEISIAQMVSLASWIKYFTTAVDNIPGTLGDITFFLEPDLKAAIISATFAGAKYGLSYIGMSGEELAEWIINYGVGPIVTAHDFVIQAMSLSQEAVHLNLIAGARQWQIAKDIATDMDPKLKAQLVLTSHGFDGFTKRYAKSGSSGDERGRLADVTVRSRDAFTRERNWTIHSPFDIPFVRKDGALKKRGGTELIGYDEWRGIDTLELHGRHFGCGSLKNRWCSDVQIPVGWGGVNVNAGGGDAGRGYHGNAYGENRRTAGRADSDMREPAYYHFSGLPGVRELKDLDPKADISTGITILVSKDHADTTTSGGAAIAKPGGRLAQFDDKPSGGKLMALSRAQIFFDRIAARADGKTEIGSLYNPYWRVRLVAPTAGDKAYAAAQQGGMVLP